LSPSTASASGVGEKSIELGRREWRFQKLRNQILIPLNHFRDFASLDLQLTQLNRFQHFENLDSLKLANPSLTQRNHFQYFENPDSPKPTNLTLALALVP
jgi:hypothetical protein